VFLATVICSDPECAVEAEVVADDLALLEVELCADCDCAVTVLAISELAPAEQLMLA
jgi:hypothetical protein